MHDSTKPFPLIETPILILKELKLTDAPALFSTFSLDQVTRYYDLDSFKQLDQAEELINRWGERYNQRKGIRWGVTLKSNPKLVIGTCGIHNWQKEHGKAELGYELHPEYWGKGIMQEALSYILEYCFYTIQLNRLEAFYDPAKKASALSLKKQGFVVEGYLRDAFFEKGVYVDAVLAAKLKRDHVKLEVGKDELS